MWVWKATLTHSHVCIPGVTSAEAAVSMTTLIKGMRQTKWKQKQVKSAQEQPPELLRHDLKLQHMQLIQQDQGLWMQIWDQCTDKGGWHFLPTRLDYPHVRMSVYQRKSVERVDIFTLCVVPSSWWYAGLLECVFGDVRVPAWALSLCLLSQTHLPHKKKLPECEEPITNMHSLRDKNYIKYQWHALLLWYI